MQPNYKYFFIKSIDNFIQCDKLVTDETTSQRIGGDKLNITANYSNLTAFMKRHGLTKGDIAKISEKAYPTALNKINMKSTENGKTALFDIV